MSMTRVNQIYQLTVCDMEKCPPFLTGIYHTTWAISIATCQIVELLLHYRRVQHDGSMFSPSKAARLCSPNSHHAEAKEVFDFCEGKEISHSLIQEPGCL